MRILIAPDRLRGALSSPQVAAAIADGWTQQRPRDELDLLPLADGGAGTAAVIASHTDHWREVEVADALGRPRLARWLQRHDGSGVVEAAEACGLHLMNHADRNPMRTTSYGVGQLLEDARAAGAEPITVATGGLASVDGGAGALIALGFRVRVRDGGGLKIGGRELVRVDRIEPAWLHPGWADHGVVCWTETTATVAQAATSAAAELGAATDEVAHLANGLSAWADVVERDLGGRWRGLPGAGAGGALGFGLAAGLQAGLVLAPAAVAHEVGLDRALAEADLVVAAQTAVDLAGLSGDVLGHVLAAAQRAEVPVAVVTLQQHEDVPALADHEEIGPLGPQQDPAAEVAGAAARLAARTSAGAPVGRE